MRARTRWHEPRPAHIESEIHKQAISGEFDADIVEFITSINDARNQIGRQLKSSEIFEVLWSLGYRKTNP